MGAMSEAYAKCGFETYNKSADLYCLFAERGYSLLKPGGLQSFIMPNKWMLVAYGKELRKFMAKTDMQQIINFGDVQFFDEATIYVCIFVTRKSSERDKEVLALSLNQKTYHGNFLHEVPEQLASYPSETFGEKEWIIQPKAHFNILQKMQSGVALKDMPLSIYRGILTGYNDAFFIDGATKDRLVAEDPRSAEIIKPLLRGRDIQAWMPEWDELYLINPHNGVKGKGLAPICIDDYPAVKQHLDIFLDKLSRRIDKGITPYNLRNCDYIDEFSKPKIMYPNMTSLFPFIYDEKGFFGNDKTFMITANGDTVNLKYITAILNSRLCKLWIWYNCPELQGGTREIRKVYFENFCIPLDADQQPLADLTDLQMQNVSQLQEKRCQFLHGVTNNFEGVKITTALQQFDQMDFIGFMKELKKQKIAIPLKQQGEWENFFNDCVAECLELSAQIKATDEEIDNKVFDLYGLTEEERRIVMDA